MKINNLKSPVFGAFPFLRQRYPSFLLQKIDFLQKHHYCILTLYLWRHYFAIYIFVVTLFLRMKIGRVAQVQMGVGFRSRLEADPTGDVSVIQMKDIDETNLLHLEGAIRFCLPNKGRERHLLRPGDLLFRSRGRSNGVALVPEGIGTAVLAAPMLRLRPKHALSAYLYWFLNSPETQARLTAMAEGTSVRMISAEALKDLDVPVPSRERQHVIAQAAALMQQEQTLIKTLASLRYRLTTHLLMNSAYEANQ